MFGARLSPLLDPLGVPAGVKGRAGIPPLVGVWGQRHQIASPYKAHCVKEKTKKPKKGLTTQNPAGKITLKVQTLQQYINND